MTPLLVHRRHSGRSSSHFFRRWRPATGQRTEARIGKSRSSHCRQPVRVRTRAWDSAWDTDIDQFEDILSYQRSEGESARRRWNGSLPRAPRAPRAESSTHLPHETGRVSKSILGKSSLSARCLEFDEISVPGLRAPLKKCEKKTRTTINIVTPLEGIPL